MEIRIERLQDTMSEEIVLMHAMALALAIERRGEKISVPAVIKEAEKLGTSDIGKAIRLRLASMSAAFDTLLLVADGLDDGRFLSRSAIA